MAATEVSTCFRYPVITPPSIINDSSQQLWSSWNPTWGEIKAAADDVRASLLTNQRPDKMDPYHGLVHLTLDQRRELIKSSQDSICSALVRANGRAVDMQGGLVYPITAHGCSRVSAINTTFHHLEKDSNDSCMTLLNLLPKKIRQHVCYAGGAVKSRILDKLIPLSTDHDLFIVGECDARSITRSMIELWSDMTIQATRTRWAITLHIRVPGHNQNCIMQIVLRHYHSPCEVVYGFDLDPSAVLYHDDKYYATPGAIHSLRNMTIFIDVDRLSTTGVYRYLKYWIRHGFTLSLPMPWPLNYIDPFCPQFKYDNFNKRVIRVLSIEPKYKNTLFGLFYSVLIRAGGFHSPTLSHLKTSDYNEVDKFNSNYNTVSTQIYELNKIYKNNRDPIYIIGPKTYIVHFRRGDQLSDDDSEILNPIDCLLSMPKSMVKLYPIWSMPTETEFVTVNPGQQGDIGVIESNGRKIITGSFQPVAKTWGQWMKVPPLTSVSSSNWYFNHIILIGINPQLILPRIGNSLWLIGEYMTGRCEVRDQILKLMGDDDDVQFAQRLADPLLYVQHQELLNKMKVYTDVPSNVEYKNTIGQYYRGFLRKCELVEIGQRHLIDPTYGMGTIICIDDSGVVLYLDRIHLVCNARYNGRHSPEMNTAISELDKIFLNGSGIEFYRFVRINWLEESIDNKSENNVVQDRPIHIEFGNGELSPECETNIDSELEINMGPELEVVA